MAITVRVSLCVCLTIIELVIAITWTKMSREDIWEIQSYCVCFIKDSLLLLPNKVVSMKMI